MKHFSSGLRCEAYNYWVRDRKNVKKITEVGFGYSMTSKKFGEVPTGGSLITGNEAYLGRGVQRSIGGVEVE